MASFAAPCKGVPIHQLTNKLFVVFVNLVEPTSTIFLFNDATVLLFNNFCLYCRV